jgi:hypothetical protein
VDGRVKPGHDDFWKAGIPGLACTLPVSIG